MKTRKIIISAAIALMFVGVFAQKPALSKPQKPQSKTEVAATTAKPAAATGAAKTTGVQPQAQQGNKTIVNIKSRRMFPMQIGDSTIHAFVGNVVAYHNGTIIQCDSAVRYNENKIECFKNVLINKEKIYIYGDRVVYNRLTSTAEVFSPLIKMIDDNAILYTYNFKYNTLSNVGTFSGGGTMHNGPTMLFESERGYYFGNTHDAVGVGNVELQDSLYLITSDSLGFNMDTEISTFYKQSTIWNNKDEILSANSGWYNTKTDHYHFMSNAYVLSDKQEVWADDIDYRATNDDAELKRDIQIYDREQSVYAFGDYGKYIGQKGDAMLTENPSVMSISEQQDSVFMRADSIFLYVIDSTSIYSADYIGNRKPVNDSENSDEQLVSGNTSGKTVDNPANTSESDGENNVSDDSGTEIPKNDTGAGTELNQQKTDSTTLQPLTKAQIKKQERDERRKEKLLQREKRDSVRNAERIAKNAAKGIVEDTVATDTVTSISDSTVITDSLTVTEGILNASDSTALKNSKPDSKSSTADKTEDEDKERVIVGYYNVKIFKNDLQAVCDSLVAFSRDSTAHLHRNPVMWNGGSQIKSDLAIVYTKNQALDKAVFTGGEKTGNPVMSSEVDKNHYNQITGKVIEALFRDSEIYRTNVNGNAQTLYYMQEDGTMALQGFMVMSCSDMSFLIIKQEIDEIIFRGNPEYAIYPMNLIPASQSQRLPNFVWEVERRPAKKDVFNRTIRPSQREQYESLPKPIFPLTASINAYRNSIIQSGFWKDRDDEVTLDAIEYVQRLLTQGQVQQVPKP